MTEARQRLGKKGEDAACTYLERKGYVICRRNYRCRYGEIDIIAAKGGELSFVEERIKGVPKLPQQLKWEQKMKRYEKADSINPPAKDLILFVGSSTMENWKTLAQSW